jgi:hypothetical protein
VLQVQAHEPFSVLLPGVGGMFLLQVHSSPGVSEPLDPEGAPLGVPLLPPLELPLLPLLEGPLLPLLEGPLLPLLEGPLLPLLEGPLLPLLEGPLLPLLEGPLLPLLEGPLLPLLEAPLLPLLELELGWPGFPGPTSDVFRQSQPFFTSGGAFLSAAELPTFFPVQMYFSGVQVQLQDQSFLGFFPLSFRLGVGTGCSHFKGFLAQSHRLSQRQTMLESASPTHSNSPFSQHFSKSVQGAKGSSTALFAGLLSFCSHPTNSKHALRYTPPLKDTFIGIPPVA